MIPAAKEDIVDAIREAGLPETIRGEALTLEQFAGAGQCIKQKNKSIKVIEIFLRFDA